MQAAPDYKYTAQLYLQYFLRMADLAVTGLSSFTTSPSM